jgi:hypothetical protein
MYHDDLLCLCNSSILKRPFIFRYRIQLRALDINFSFPNYFTPNCRRHLHKPSSVLIIFNYEWTQNSSNKKEFRNEMEKFNTDILCFLLLSSVVSRLPPTDINLLKPTGHVMHQQFNVKQLYVLPTLYLCVLYLSENKQRLVPLTA